jgi:hypothetical protein
MCIGDNVITPTLITPTLNTSTVTDSLCNSGAFSNPNAVREFPFNFFRMQRYCFKAFQRAQQNIFLQKKILFHLIKMLSLISLFLRFPSYFPQNSG